MASFAETGPREPVTEGIRVDKVQPRARIGRKIRAGIVILVAIVLLVPVAVMAMTAFKSRSDVVSVPPKFVFQPTLEGFVFLLTERSQLSTINKLDDYCFWGDVFFSCSGVIGCVCF